MSLRLLLSVTKILNVGGDGIDREFLLNNSTVFPRHPMDLRDDAWRSEENV